MTNEKKHRDRGDANRPSDTRYAVIWRMGDAVRDGDIKAPFTVEDIELWMDGYKIRKEDGTKYKKGYVNALLSNSYVGRKNQTNRNRQCLDRRFNDELRVYEYWFV